METRDNKVIMVKANNINGAYRKILKKAKKQNLDFIYQITTRIKGYKLNQPVFDFFNGNISSHFNLKL